MIKLALLVLMALAFAVPILVAATGTGPDDPPPVFDKRPYVDAKKAAEDGKKWFIVKATAVWCMPCKQMDKTTWRDEKVVRWLKDHAVASVFDVDKDTELAKQLSIRAMPTMIAFKDGKEFDRIVGMKPPEEFLAWLEGVQRGEKSIEAVRKRAGDREAKGEKVDVRARMELARSLAQSGKTAEAAEEYVWLWQHMLEHDEAMSGVRVSFMAREMQQLGAEDEGAKKKFTELRDATTKLIEAERVDPTDLSDWLTLNRIVGDSAATLAWYDRVKDQGRWKGLIKRASLELTQLFIAEKRWADIGQMVTNSVAELEQEHQLMLMIPKQQAPANASEEARKRVEDMPMRMLRRKAQYMYAGLLAAGREQDADKLAAKAREYDPSPAMVKALVSTALEAGEPRREHVEWLQKAGDAEQLVEKVKAALSSTK